MNRIQLLAIIIIFQIILIVYNSLALAQTTDFEDLLTKPVPTTTNFIENLNCKLIWGTLCLNDRNTKLNNIFSLKELLSIDSITCDNKNLKFIESCVCIAGHDVWKYSKNKLLSTEQRDILNYYCKGFEKFKNNYKVRLYINIDLEDNNRQKYSVENRIILKE